MFTVLITWSNPKRSTNRTSPATQSSNRSSSRSSDRSSSRSSRSSDHPIIRSSNHPISRSSDHPIIQSSDHQIIRSSDHPIILIIRSSSRSSGRQLKAQPCMVPWLVPGLNHMWAAASTRRYDHMWTSATTSGYYHIQYKSRPEGREVTLTLTYPNLTTHLINTPVYI